jgi:hypothetical protein
VSQPVLSLVAFIRMFIRNPPPVAGTLRSTRESGIQSPVYESLRLSSRRPGKTVHGQNGTVYTVSDLSRFLDHEVYSVYCICNHTHHQHH